jgi:dTDP-glucose 4,6-dehydratase
MLKNIMVTGGSGFIGTNFIKYAYKFYPDWYIFNLDALTYAGNPLNNRVFDTDPRYTFLHGDITDITFLSDVFARNRFDGVFHFAAESHVDRSIADPEVFLNTNVIGTFRLLEAALHHTRNHPESEFKFIHVSTDEVYGSLGFEASAFTEDSLYDPSSPYSASKASSDHLAKAYYKTYGLPVVVTNCSNNYGPYQFPEKLIPLVILNILEEKPLPIYGRGENIRDWLYVADHCEALTKIFERGMPGETYNIGGGQEKTNLEVVQTICDLVDQKIYRKGSSRELITFVPDRPGHDLRYAIDSSKTQDQIGFVPRFSFEQALLATVDWYLENRDWVRSVQTGEYRQWVKEQYATKT